MKINDSDFEDNEFEDDFDDDLVISIIRMTR